MADKRKPMIFPSYRSKRNRRDSVDNSRLWRIAGRHGDLQLSGSPTPVCFLFLERSQWKEFPADITESLRSAFRARRLVTEFSIGDSRYLINFSQKLQLNTNTCYLRSIAWIDDTGKRFFPVKCFEGYGAHLVNEVKALRSSSVDSLDSSPCQDADLIKESIVITIDRRFHNAHGAELDLAMENNFDVKKNTGYTDENVPSDSGLQHNLERGLDANHKSEITYSWIDTPIINMNPEGAVNLNKNSFHRLGFTDVNPNDIGSDYGLNANENNRSVINDSRSYGIEAVNVNPENVGSIHPSEYHENLPDNSSQEMSDLTSTNSSYYPNDNDDKDEHQSKPPAVVPPSPGFTLLEDKIARLDESNPDFSTVKQKFMDGLGKLAPFATVIGISQDLHRSMSGCVREQVFKRQEEVTRSIRGDPNVRYCWYSTSKQGVSSLVLHGFGQPSMPLNGAMYGVGVYLSPEQLSYISAIHADIDDNGEQHVVLCRAIMGNMEQVPCGSDQFHPGTEDYDSGIDDQKSPKRYIVWSTHMNTHILPEYIISFKLPPRIQDMLATLKGKQMLHKRSNVNTQHNWTGPCNQINNGFHLAPETKEKRVPKSPWMSFPVLFSIMKSKLSQKKMELLQRYYIQFKTGRISRSDLIRAVRLIAGDQVVVNAIKSMQMQTQALGAVFVQNLLPSGKHNVVNNNIIA